MWWLWLKNHNHLCYYYNVINKQPKTNGGRKMKLSQILKITESCMVVRIYDRKINKVIYTGRVNELLKIYDSRLERNVVHINHSEPDDEWDIEFVI